MHALCCLSLPVSPSSLCCQVEGLALVSLPDEQVWEVFSNVTFQQRSGGTLRWLQGLELNPGLTLRVSGPGSRWVGGGQVAHPQSPLGAGPALPPPPPPPPPLTGQMLPARFLTAALHPD